MGMGRRPFVLVLIVAVVGPVHSQLFNTDTVRHQDLATLTCNVTKVSSKRSVSAVTELCVGKKAPNDTKFHELIRYAYAVAETAQVKKIDPVITNSNGRITVTADGMLVNGSIDYNADTMNVELTINNATCDDAGVYKCKAIFQDLRGRGHIKEVENSLSVTARLIKEVTGNITPEKTRFHGDESVTLVCRVVGQPHVSIIWRYQECTTASTPNPSMQDWSSASHIMEDNQGAIQAGGCNYTRLESKLMNVKLSNGTRKICLIQCVMGTGGQNGGSFVEHQQWTTTIEYGTPGEDGGGDTGEDKGEDTAGDKDKVVIAKSGGDDITVGLLGVLLPGILVLIG